MSRTLESLGAVLGGPCQVSGCSTHPGAKEAYRRFEVMRVSGLQLRDELLEEVHRLRPLALDEREVALEHEDPSPFRFGHVPLHVPFHRRERLESRLELSVTELLLHEVVQGRVQSVISVNLRGQADRLGEIVEAALITAREPSVRARLEEPHAHISQPETFCSRESFVRERKRLWVTPIEALPCGQA